MEPLRESNSPLAFLNLSKNQLEDEGVQIVSQFISWSENIQSLILKCCAFGTEGMTSIARALYSNTSLTSLDVSENFCGREGANALSDALRANRKIQEIHFGSDGEGENLSGICRVLKYCKSLQKIECSGNTMSFAHVQRLNKCLLRNPTLSDIDLSNNDLNSRSLSFLFTGSFQILPLKRLVLNYCDLRNAQVLSSFEGFKSLESLELVCCHLTELHVRNLMDSTKQLTLNQLILNDNSFGKKGLMILVNRLTDASMHKSYSSLETVALSNIVNSRKYLQVFSWICFLSF